MWRAGGARREGGRAGWRGGEGRGGGLGITASPPPCYTFTPNINTLLSPRKITFISYSNPYISFKLPIRSNTESTSFSWVQSYIDLVR